MKIRCDACEKAPAVVICCADEAALCGKCDVEIHAANKLASKHQRLLLECLSNKLPRCDICQERTAFIFCVEDRALFCRDCDEAIHVPGSLSGNHQRYLATGIRVALSSMCNKDSEKGHYEPPNQNFALLDPKIPTTHESASSCIPSAWAVDEFLQLSDYESGDKVRSRGCKIYYISTHLKYLGSPQYDLIFDSMNLHKGSPGGFGELEWFADIGLFHEQIPEGTLTAAEVPELPTQQASNAAFCRNSEVGRSNKKPRIEISEEEECFTVPDLG